MKKVGILLLAVLVFTASAKAAITVDERTYAEKRGCKVIYPSKKSYSKIKVMLRHHQVLKEIQRKRSKHYAVCVATRKKSRAVWDFIRRSYQWRKQYAHRWPIKWNSLPYVAKSWTAGVSSRESGSRVGETSSYKQNLKSGVCDCWSFFQWMHSTWHSACGCSISVFSASWYHQAVTAWYWHLSHPSGQWPNTGE